jgi:hypothetical protein
MTRFARIFGVVLFITALIAQTYAINLGGTDVPKSKFVVYLLVGHSNMAGIVPAGNDTVADPRGWVYRWSTTKTWEPARENNSLTNGLTPHGTGGPGMPFVKGLAARHPGSYIGVINNAAPSTTCHGLNTGYNGSGSTADQSRYWPGALFFQQIITAAREVKNDATIGGIVCMLGEIEATRAANVAVCQNFSSDIAEMVRDIRDSLGLPNIPFIMGAYENEAKNGFAITNPWPAIIKAQIDSVPFKLTNSVIVNSVGLSYYSDHDYDENGEKEWARRAVDSLEAKKFFPSTAIRVAPGSNSTPKIGSITVAMKNGVMKFLYSPKCGRCAQLAIFTLRGERIYRTPMTAAGGTLVATWDGGAPSSRSSGFYIATVNESGTNAAATFLLQ